MSRIANWLPKIARSGLGTRNSHEKREIGRDEALERIRSLRKPLPESWKFDREEANSR